MNIPEDYDDDVEQRNTHPAMLPKQEPVTPPGSHDQTTLRTAVGTDETMNRRTIKASGHRRSVLSERDSSKMRTLRSL